MAAHDSRTPALTYSQLVDLVKEVDEKYRLPKRPARLWQCSNAPQDRVTILDTAPPGADTPFLIPDAQFFPRNTLLVVLHPSFIQALEQAWARHATVWAGEDLVASMLIDIACSKDPTLNAKLGWR